MNTIKLELINGKNYISLSDHRKLIDKKDKEIRKLGKSYIKDLNRLKKQLRSKRL